MRIVINIETGFISAASTDSSDPMEILILDHDTDGFNEVDGLKKVDDQEVSPTLFDVEQIPKSCIDSLYRQAGIVE